MKCDEALVLISGHLDRENTIEEETALQAHLNGCEHCREVFRSFEITDKKLASNLERAPEGFASGVMAQIKKESAKKKRRPWTGLAVAAALVIVIGAGAAMDISDEPQTASVVDMQVMTKGRSLADIDVLAQELAQERSASVAVVNELYYEIETYPCETLEEGYLLYVLPDRDAALFLRENYGCVIYEPAGEASAAISYALLAP